MTDATTALLYNGRIRVDFNPRNHRYYVNGANPDGVSSIERAVIPKFALVNWAARTGVAHVRQGYMKHLEATSEIMEQSAFLALCEEAEVAHDRIKESAGDSGSATHDIIEKHLRGEPYDIPDDPAVISGFGAFKAWLAQTDIERLETERIVFSEKYFYAGRTDLVGRRNGSRLIADFKTGSAFYEGQAYQITGYACAIEEETGEKFDEGLIIHLDKKTGRFTEYTFPIDDDMRGAWKAAVIHYKNLKRVTKLVKELNNGQR